MSTGARDSEKTGGPGQPGRGNPRRTAPALALALRPEPCAEDARAEREGRAERTRASRPRQPDTLGRTRVLGTPRRPQPT